jgi:hypothetical protein
MLSTMHNHVRPRVMWIPLVLVGSILYWTVALGLGRMSLSLLGDGNDEDLVNCPGSRSVMKAVQLPSPQGPGPVEVQIISRPDSPTGSGGNRAMDDGTGRLPAIDDSPSAPALDDPPGRTSY